MSGAGPGRLGDPHSTIGSDPRTDPRLAAALEAFGLSGHPEVPPLSPASPREDLLGFCTAAEAGFEGLFGAAQQGAPPIEGVESHARNLPGADHVTLYIHQPVDRQDPLPCIVHLHGGGMVIIEGRGACYTRWRDELAATGLVVVGVEFRNGGGVRGVHPFPAGLDDCVTALRWASQNLDELGASHVVVSGESGGANLALASTLRAKQEGWVDQIAGVYAQCPMIADPREPATGRPSLTENDGYFISHALLALLAEVYDPEGKCSSDLTCWPLNARPDDVMGLPPHAISVNELDPLRDEGLAYYRLLAEAGVPAEGRIVPGTCHAGDVIFRSAIPDVYASTIRDISAFARAVAS